MLNDIAVMKECWLAGFSYAQYVEAAQKANVYVQGEESFNEITKHWYNQLLVNHEHTTNNCHG